MFGRRLLLLVAVLVATSALAAVLAPQDLRRSPARSDRGSTPTSPRAGPGAPNATSPTTVNASLPAGLQRRGYVGVTVGDLLELIVTADRPDTVAIDGYDRLAEVDSDSPARFDFIADRAGRFGVRLVDSGRRVGLLDVRAAAPQAR
jgi:hypothetical protein